ncbi:MAG: molybdenum cofactor biosynthesis protein B [Acidimicrobiales bacterium]
MGFSFVDVGTRLVPRSVSGHTVMVASDQEQHDREPGRDVARRVKVVTVSDGVVAGTRQDSSGGALVEVLSGAGWEVVDHRCIADGIESVRDTLIELCDGFSGLVVTTGGTGFGPRDLTPEGTAAALDRHAPGMAEAMRTVNPDGLGRLSRALAGTRGQALILNTPGSTRGAIETLEAVLDVCPHAVELLAGGRPH